MEAQNVKKKEKKARHLRGEGRGIFDMLSKVDYVESGEIFKELGRAESDREKKEYYFKESIATFEMHKGKYGFFLGAEVCKILYELFHDDLEKYIFYRNKFGELLHMSGRFFLSGQNYVGMGDYLLDKRKEDSLEAYKKAEKMFLQDEGETKYHRNDILKKILSIELEMENFERALQVLENSDVKYRKLSIQLLQILLGIPLKEEPEDKIIVDLINSDGKERLEIIENFESAHALPKHMEKILEVFKNRSNPETDIC